MTVGWFPRFNEDGSRLTWERPGYWLAQWLTPDTEIAQNGTHLVIGGAITAFPACNELSAGGGRWAGWRPDVGVFTSWGTTLSAAGCPVVNHDGKVGYVDDRQASAKYLVFGGTRVSFGAITDVRASRTALVWSQGGRTWGLRLDRADTARVIQAAPQEFRPIPIDTPSGPWVLNHTHTGIVVRPFGETHGYRFDNGGQTFYPDAVWRNGQIVAVFTNDRGEQSAQTFDLLAPRVPLGVRLPLPVPFPAPDPQPRPEPIPMSQPLPPVVRATRDRYVARFPVPQIAPGESQEVFEDRCRAWVRALAEQVYFDTGNPFWGVKNAGGGRPQSKDAIAFNGPRLISWDQLLGVGTGRPTLIAEPAGEDITGQVFVPVSPVNHLGTARPPKDDTPPPPVVNLAAVLARLDLMEARSLAAQAETTDALLRLAAAIERLRQPPPVRFPNYKGRNRFLGEITLEPQP